MTSGRNELNVLPSPTDIRTPVASELERWRALLAGPGYRYGTDPGPVAVRAVRYHRAFVSQGGTALDAGCGEGQDLAYLAACGYRATGVELTPEGCAKAERLLAERGLRARVIRADLRGFVPDRPYDLVLAVNALQFLGADAPDGLDRLAAAVAPGGVIGLSLFGREPGQPSVTGTLFLLTLEELLARFGLTPGDAPPAGLWQPLEAATLLQWNPTNGRPQSFVTLIARRRTDGSAAP